MDKSVEERFWKKVNKVEGECWEWTASLSADGYGKFSVSRKPQQAHRISYGLVKGEIPEGLHIDHLCRNRKCVNPNHLEAVTQRENLLRGETIPAKNAAKTHCPSGHIYDDENTYVSKFGMRYCRTCRRKYVRRCYDRIRKRGAAN